MLLYINRNIFLRMNFVIEFEIETKITPWKSNISLHNRKRHKFVNYEKHLGYKILNKIMT